MASLWAGGDIGLTRYHSRAALLSWFDIALFISCASYSGSIFMYSISFSGVQSGDKLCAI